MTLLGIGFLLFRILADLSIDVNVAALFFALFSLTSGIEFLISAGVSYRLANSWGLISSAPKASAIVPSNTTP